IAGVGFDLYVRLVGEAVEAYKALAKGETIDATDQAPKEIRIDLPVDAHIPESYINSERLRLEIYRKIASSKDNTDLQLIVEEMEDRYGPVPEEVSRLLAVARLRHQARRAGVTDIGVQGTRIKVHPVELA
ncbi:transcription-repair coupling factor, partial [Acinetobacter baumannii]|nr:transcription-repair coupling factor [Acinetobacter baumannii]